MKEAIEKKVITLIDREGRNIAVTRDYAASIKWKVDYDSSEWWIEPAGNGKKRVVVRLTDDDQYWRQYESSDGRWQLVAKANGTFELYSADNQQTMRHNDGLRTFLDIATKCITLGNYKGDIIDAITKQLQYNYVIATDDYGTEVVFFDSDIIDNSDDYSSIPRDVAYGIMQRPLIDASPNDKITVAYIETTPEATPADNDTDDDKYITMTDSKGNTYTATDETLANHTIIKMYDENDEDRTTPIICITKGDLLAIPMHETAHGNAGYDICNYCETVDIDNYRIDVREIYADWCIGYGDGKWWEYTSDDGKWKYVRGRDAEFEFEFGGDNQGYLYYNGKKLVFEIHEPGLELDKWREEDSLDSDYIWYIDDDQKDEYIHAAECIRDEYEKDYYPIYYRGDIYLLRKRNNDELSDWAEDWDNVVRTMRNDIWAMCNRHELSGIWRCDIGVGDIYVEVNRRPISDDE